MKIDIDKYLQMQPSGVACASDEFFVRLAVRLGKVWDASSLLQSLDHSLRHEALMAVVGYFQDIVADSGLWRSFISLHHRWYGTWLPGLAPGNDYVECELNDADLRFVLRKTFARANTKVEDADIEQLASLFFAALDDVYLSAPTPEHYDFAQQIELHDPDDAMRVYELSNWLFWDSYLMRLCAPWGSEPPIDSQIRDAIMASQTVGPIPLKIGEWMELIVNNKFPSSPTK